MSEFPSAMGLYILLAAVLTNAAAVLLFYWRRRKNGVYSADRLIPILEEYAVICVWRQIRDPNDLNPPEIGKIETGHAPYYVSGDHIPDLPDFPADIIWHSLPEPLMRRSLLFPNMVRDEKRYLEGVWDPGDTRGSLKEKYDIYGRISAEALGIAKELREYHGMYLRPPSLEWKMICFQQYCLKRGIKRGII